MKKRRARATLARKNTRRPEMFRGRLVTGQQGIVGYCLRPFRSSSRSDAGIDGFPALLHALRRCFEADGVAAGD